MTTFDFAPLYRSTVGFDRLFEMLDHSARPDWPPYDIEKTGETAYRITMALAGFGPEDVEVTQHGTQLLVSGRKQPQQGKPNLLHQGIAQRSFKQDLQPRGPRQGRGRDPRERPPGRRPRPRGPRAAEAAERSRSAPSGRRPPSQDNSPKQVETVEGQRSAA